MELEGKQEGAISTNFLIYIFIDFGHQFNSYLIDFSMSKVGPWPSLSCI